MLAGPPRVVQLLTATLLIGLGLWYLRLARAPASGLHLANHAPPPALRPHTAPKNEGDEDSTPDFSVPLRFKDGFEKPAGENYTWKVVVPKTSKEDLSWLKNEVPDGKIIVYEVDNPDAANRIPQNKGREAMVCSYSQETFPKHMGLTTVTHLGLPYIPHRSLRRFAR
jgi:hypothetical protein